MTDFLKMTAPGIAGLNPYVPGKPIEELERELGIAESIKLASNENPLGPSPLGWAAAQEAAGDINLYPDDNAFRLKNKLAQHFAVASEQILVGRGSSEILDLVARTFLCPGVNAVFSEHAFAMYPIFTQMVGGELRAVAARPADAAEMPFGHDLDAMAAAVDENTRVVFVANPNNPTGTWLRADPLKRFIANLPSSVVVVLDEAYCEYVEESDYPNGLDWLGEFPNLLVTRTFSKIYGLAGLRVGYGIGNPELISVIGRARHPFNVGNIGLAAAEAALGDEQFLSRSREINSAGLVQMRQGLAELGLSALPSVGNFICVDFARPTQALYDALLREGVIVRPVAGYGLPNFLRFSIGNETENQLALAALAKVLGS